MMDPFGPLGYGSQYGNIASAMQAGSPRMAYRPVPFGEESEDPGRIDPSKKDVQNGTDDPIAKATGRKECQTCKNRKYVDGSDENVSFKSAARINPNAVESKVRAHEQEHVANAYDKAEQNGGKVLQASVTLKYAICPECGRSYCAGGLTSTKIAYKEDTPYGKNEKSLGKEAATGNHIDAAV
jgi:hypothetical protein